MKIKAYAKVNLALKIIRKRLDNYHDIYTIMDMIDIYDSIYIKGCNKTVFKCSDKNLENDNNLILKAIKILQDECDNAKDKGAYIYLKKNIPYGAGLGGGSSDAAYVIRYLNKLWKLGLSFEQMASIALKVGSDVPFFLLGQRGILSGIGERVEKINSDIKLYYLLICPGYSLSTKQVYENNHIASEDYVKTNLILEAFKNDNKEQIISNLFNDLTISACSINLNDPKIIDIINDLNNYISNNNYQAKAIMSGSGSTVFACFSKKSDCLDVYRYLKSKGYSRIIKCSSKNN